MNVDLQKLEAVLSSEEVIFLSTCWQNEVTARPVSPLNKGLIVYVRTSATSQKARQMMQNSNVAICVKNYYLIGKAVCVGSVQDEKNTDIRNAYQLRYPGAFTEQDDTCQPDEQFFRIELCRLSEWIYEGDSPIGLATQTIE